MASHTNSDHIDLTRQAALILALGIFAWSALMGTELIDAVFRAVVVYMVVSIIAIVTRRLLSRMAEMSVKVADEEEGEQAQEGPETVSAEENSDVKSPVGVKD
ncbi:hypothetical protein HQ587_00700 [bacterium]|nr:hypothetical protein [bacterium]